MAAQEQSLLNVQTNLSNTSRNVEKNLIKVVKDVESNILNKDKIPEFSGRSYVGVCSLNGNELYIKYSFSINGKFFGLVFGVVKSDLDKPLSKINIPITKLNDTTYQTDFIKDTISTENDVLPGYYNLLKFSPDYSSVIPGYNKVGPLLNFKDIEIFKSLKPFYLIDKKILSF